MTKRNQDKIRPVENTVTDKANEVDGYPFYPVSEDIYSANKEEENIDPDELSKMKKQTDQKEISTPENELDFEEDKSGSDLDVPGAELDDEQEAIGSEDEENNYYSLGGDDHYDLDEDRD
jgi:hypothetical protein